MRIRVLISIAVLGILFFMISAITVERNVYRVRDGTVITFDHMLGDLKTADLVFVGEVHDIGMHHRIELDIIRGFHEANIPISIGLEMFRSDSQKKLDEWVRGDISPDQFRSVYSENWGRPWPLYKDILLYAREHRIPLIGLNIPRGIAESVARSGFAALPEIQKNKLPPGITCDVDDTYRDYIRKAYAGHARSSGRGFGNFCEAQMVWDKAMGWRLAEYRKMNPGRPLIVLAGAGHAWKRGIPAQIIGPFPFTPVIVMPFIPGQIDPSAVTDRDADYVVLGHSRRER